jgi:N-acyl-D-amino-acid deacylase
MVALTGPLPSEVDVLIEGGTVVDGTGARGYPGTVAVVGDRLLVRPTAPGGSGRSRAKSGDSVAGADATVRAGRTIDARGLVVAPGFIDLHSHGGLAMLAEPLHEPKVRQGITTEVIGVDGNAYAPFPSRRDLLDYVILNAGLDGRPDIDYDWSTVAEYLARYDRRTSVNVAYVVGSSALRIASVGWDDVEADPAAMADQRARLREALEDGAFGLSTGLDYPPGSFATTAELADLATEAARHRGIYHTHVRYSLGDGFLDPYREAIEIGRRSGVAVHITHFYHRPTFPGPPEVQLALVDEARAEGLDVTFDLYPYEWASTRLLIMLPQWIQAGGLGPLRERLADRRVRERVRAESAVLGRRFAGDRSWDEVRLGAFALPENAPWEGRTLGEYLAATGLDPVDAICELLLAEDLRINQVTPGPHRAGTNVFIRHPQAMIGTDGVMVGAKPAPRTYGTYPRILGELVREERLLGLEEAVHKMTGASAARLGLDDRGLIVDGRRADLVVFDPARIRTLATYDEPRRFPEGIPYVLVNGVPVVDGGEHTGATPGRALRRGRTD